MILNASARKTSGKKKKKKRTKKENKMQLQVIEAATLQQNKFSKFSLTSFHLQEGHYKSAMVNSFTRHNHRMAVWSKQFHKKLFIKINH